MIDQRVQQQRSDAVAPMVLVHAQRQDVAHLAVLVGPRLGQNVLVLLVHAHERFDLGHDQADDGHIVDGGQCVEPGAGRDVDVPGQWVVDGEPVLAERAHLSKGDGQNICTNGGALRNHLFQVVWAQKPHLDVRCGAERHNRIGIGRWVDMVVLSRLILRIPGREEYNSLKKLQKHKHNMNNKINSRIIA